MAFYNLNEIILNTPNRDEILQEGPPEHSKSSILGKGSYGTVFKAVFGGKQVAVKIIKITWNDMNDAIFNESNILGWCHDNIVQTLKIESTLFYGMVIMERFPGQCLQMILDSVELPFEHRIHISFDMINALSYCHDRGIMHLDVKPQNVLVAFLPPESLKRNNWRRYICKICDFGSSALIWRESSKRENTRKRVQGTVRYMAPEVIRGDLLTPAADIFSFGVSMWQLMSRELPYSWIESNEAIAYQVVKTNLRPTSRPTRSKDCTNREVTTSPHKNCLCEHFSSEISHRTLDHIRTMLPEIKTMSPFRSKLPFNQTPRQKHKNETSRNLIDTFQNTFVGLNENFLSEELNCNSLEDHFKNDIWLKEIFGKTGFLFVNEAKEERYEELFNLCWHSDPTQRPKTFDLMVEIDKIKWYNGSL